MDILKAIRAKPHWNKNKFITFFCRGMDKFCSKYLLNNSYSLCMVDFKTINKFRVIITIIT